MTTNDVLGDEDAVDEKPAERFYRQVEVLSAAILALATIATAWSAYQSARWNGDQAYHHGQASVAIIKIGKFANLAEQKISLHTNMFGQWAAAVSVDNTALAGFLFARLPEPLKAATIAWQATQPFTNPAAPATPFEMPSYTLAESAEMERWEGVAAVEAVAGDRAGEISDRYLLLTIVFAAVLFFGGISGKFRWQAIDVAVLVFGVLILAAGSMMLVWLPTK